MKSEMVGWQPVLTTMETMNRWLHRYSHINWALADQAIVSGVNFVVGVLLARFLGISDYGGYVLLYMILLFVNTLHMGFVSSPMMVLINNSDDNRQEEYKHGVMGLGLLTSWVLATCVLLGFWSIEILFEYRTYQGIPWVLALTAGLFLTQDFMRRYWFAIQLPFVAFVVDAIAYGSFLVGVGIMCWLRGSLLLLHVFAVLGCAYMVSVFSSTLVASVPAPRLQRWVLAEHWKEGKWLVGAGLLTWTSYNMITVAAAWVLGPMAAAAIKVAQNIVSTINPLFLALENILPVQATRKFVEGGRTVLLRYIFRAAVFVTMPLLVISILLIIFHVSIVVWIYGKEYEPLSISVVWFSLANVFVGLILILGAGLRACGYARGIFWGMGSATFTVIGFDYPLMIWLGVQGAAMGFLIAAVIQVAVMTWLLRGYTKNNGFRFGAVSNNT